jgi:hypothetical protein
MSLEHSPARFRKSTRNTSNVMALPLRMREYIFRDEFEALAAEVGIPCPAKSVIDKLCAPAVNQGPQPAAYLAKRPLYKPVVAIAWLRSLLKPAAEALPLPPAPPRERKRKAAASPIAASPAEPTASTEPAAVA